MNNQKKKDSGSMPTVGGSSLLVIFAVLCLTIFALLSLSTVKGDTSLSEKTAGATGDFYAADVLAEKVLAKIRCGEVPEGVKQEGDTYTYTCPVSENEALHVSVRVSGSEYEILRWQSVSTLEWQADDSIVVWDGN